jgi:VWFA-related protein
MSFVALEDSMRYLRIILTLSVLALMLPGSAHAASGPLVQVTQVDNSKYPNVTVYVSVKDAAGQAITGLKQNEFSLTEDGVQVEIVDFRGGDRLVISTVLVMDCSSSMSGAKLDGAKQAALTFVDLMRSQDEAALIAFNQNVTVLQGFTADHATLKRAVASLNANGNTAWRDALYKATDMLGTADGRKSVILLTDGMDNESKNSLDAVIAFARRAGIPAYAIGLGERASLPFLNAGLDEASLKRAAQETDGRYYYTPSAAELKALYESLARGMQQEYAITYRSPRPTFDGTRRNIVVQVSGTSASGAYLERHLLSVRSDPLVGVACLLPLLLALVLPAGLSALQRQRALVVPPPISPPPPTWAQPRPGVPQSTWSPPPSVTPQPQVAATGVCAKCGAPLRAGAKFCAKCGTATGGVRSASITCLRCGNTINPGARFCNRCGARLQ